MKKNKTMKKTITLFILILSIGLRLNAQNVYIPDANFKAALVGNTNINTNGDSLIQTSEAQAYTGSIAVINLNISDLTGIEAFINITTLYCYNNNLTTLDVSSSMVLTGLYCDNNSITTLNLPNSTSLTTLYCQDNNLISLNVASNSNLVSLRCYNNNLSSLDVSNNPNLEELRCFNNSLTVLDVSSNTVLTTLYCSTNNLTALDVSNNTALTLLNCSSNNLSSLNVANGNNSNMSIMGAAMNSSLTCIQHDAGFDPTTNSSWTKDFTTSWSSNCSVSSCQNIVNIPDVNFKNALLAHGTTITGTGISTIDTDGDGEICQNEVQAYTGTINVTNKNITDFTGIQSFVNITEFICNNNSPTSLDVSSNTALTKLSCFSNQLTSLDVSNNTALTELYCDYNQLTSLDVSNNTALTKLNCYENQLTSLDLSNNTLLEELNCYNNQLTNLNISNNTALTSLSCEYNELTSLDVSNNTAITFLYCFFNQLTSIDVSNNTALTDFSCSSNQITSLDVSNNSILRKVTCSNNKLSILNLANGNNGLSNNELNYVVAYNNSNLICIQHDAGFDPTTSTGWSKDHTAYWSDDCQYTILVSAITVQGQNGVSTITTNGGTLQMEASVAPFNATDATYTWSVTNGTGSAIIDPNGVLTATGNGIVTVTATANDSSGVSGSVEITISNQSVGINDMVFENLSIYPNPTKGLLYVQSTEEINTIELQDLNGKILQVIENTDVIDLSHVAKGMYFLRLKNKEKQSVRKILID